MNGPIKKTIYAFSFLVLIFFAFYSYKTIKNRYFQGENESFISDEKPEEKSENNSNSNQENNPSENQTAEENVEENDVDFQNLKEKENNEEKDSAKIEKDDAFVNITKKDCLNDCKDYEDEDELEYCREFCGLSEAKKISGDCEDLEGLNADYCFKDLAVSKKDYSLCEEIQDEGILRMCRNRITEDIIDSQKE